MQVQLDSTSWLDAHIGKRKTWKIILLNSSLPRGTLIRCKSTRICVLGKQRSRSQISWIIDCLQLLKPAGQFCVFYIPLDAMLFSSRYFTWNQNDSLNGFYCTSCNGFSLRFWSGGQAHVPAPLPTGSGSTDSRKYLGNAVREDGPDRAFTAGKAEDIEIRDGQYALELSLQCSIFTR